MSFPSVLLCFILLRLIVVAVAPFQLNLHLTEWVSNNKDNIIVQHDCLRVDAWENKDDIQEITSYCMSEWPSKWNIQKNSFGQEFTFAELTKLNITSHQLYLWSASMDIVEDYQFYLDQLLTFNETSMIRYSYFNCTLPRFGPMCQYSFDEYNSYHSSLNEIVYDLYLMNRHKPMNQTCYIHLQCNLGQTSLCISWINICDEVIQCIGGIDEEHCWQLEINECNENEYRCKNGQCIHFSFFHDNINAPDCLDGSDEKLLYRDITSRNLIGPLFKLEDMLCSKWSNRPYGTITPVGTMCFDTYSMHIENLISIDKSDSMSNVCWLALNCYLKISYLLSSNCDNICQSGTCKQIIKVNCPSMFYMPSAPIAFGHIYFAYTKEYIIEQIEWTSEPEYICYNEKLCDGFYSNRILREFNNATCRRPKDFPFEIKKNYIGLSLLGVYVAAVYEQLYKCNTILRNDSTLCDNSTMYQCINSSKCIAQIRLFDGKSDCDYNDDEIWIQGDRNCPIKNPRMYVNCTNTNTCISRKLFADEHCNCRTNILDICDDEPRPTDYIKYHTFFSRICNNIVELLPVITDKGNETDETECEQWPCNNIYTRCDGIWNCFNAADEFDCYPSLINCSLHSYVCFSPETYDYMCLPSEKINDGNIDCVGATDESQFCRDDPGLGFKRGFYCNSTLGTECIGRDSLCDEHQTCSKGEDEKICHHVRNAYAVFASVIMCSSDYPWIRSDEEEFLCNLVKVGSYISPEYFSFGSISKYDKRITKRNTNMIFTSSLTTEIISENPHRCHRSLNLRVWLNKEKYVSTLTCLCPPSHYGDRCQYQNERVSLTIQFQTFSDSWQTPFIAVVLLIDDSDERTIHSHEQVTYIPILNCRTKFNIDLLYSTRPKNQSKQYSIHIDIYEKLTLLYRGSLLIPLSFPFLPIQRVATQLNIPHTEQSLKSCSDQQCVHGQCIRYFDDPKYSTFCQCNSGWSGRYCIIPHNCRCSPGSLCIGILANNRSICVCPINKWGSRCLLQNEECQLNITCYHGGQCIPINNYIVSNKKFMCICPKDFSGERCEISQSKIILSFEKDIILPQSMLVHFIEVKDNASPENGTTFKRIPIDRNSVTVYWSRPFHIVFIEFVLRNYYLIVVQDTYNQSMTIERTLKSSDRCPNITEVFNETFSQLHLIRRIKYYHLPCQKHSPQISCFHDDVHMCLCQDFDHQRHANCFEFNHMLKRDCRGQSNCKHDAQCLQDSVNCPETSMCICLPCYYGALCQFSSTRFGLSLDAILGDHIQPHVNIIDQPTIIQIGITFTVLMTVIGLISGVFSMMAFLNKDPRKTGCGFYLIGSSSTTLLITIIFSLKFWILLVAQMTYMTNRSFLSFQCSSLDYILRVGLHMDQWLNACVATERAITAKKGLSFDKDKSKTFAKFTIPILLLLTSSTNVHEIIYRDLIDDISNDDKRIWCVATYPAGIQIYTVAINIFHFCTPFLINLISAIIIIIETARLRTAVKTQQNYRQVLFEQLQQHKHLLITPLLLVILGIPRLIISFIPGCMQSASDAWLFLSGYFISFIPPILTFFIFVIPSKMYKQEFYKTYRLYQRKIQRYFHLAP